MDGAEIGSGMAIIIYLNALIVGFILMGFEMLGSRYLVPYFGGSMGTWAVLISMVLVSLTIGYFVGGSIVDRKPSASVLACAIALAAVYLAAVPLTVDPLMAWIMASIGYGFWGVLLAAAAISLVPLSLLGTLSPIAIRLLIRSTAESGKVAGLVYGISTIGNVVGVLMTTFVLIPAIGSREITYMFAAMLAGCAIVLFAMSRAAPQNRLMTHTGS